MWIILLWESFRNHFNNRVSAISDIHSWPGSTLTTYRVKWFITIDLFFLIWDEFFYTKITIYRCILVCICMGWWTIGNRIRFSIFHFRFLCSVLKFFALYFYIKSIYLFVLFLFYLFLLWLWHDGLSHFGFKFLIHFFYHALIFFYNLPVVFN